LIVANRVAIGEGTFGGAENKVTIVAADGIEEWPRMGKTEVARALVALVARKLTGAP
jgi:phosphopantothenoylcysteine decarboxylase/phosphopantothenate--cysteine ligase